MTHFLVLVQRKESRYKYRREIESFCSVQKILSELLSVEMRKNRNEILDFFHSFFLEILLSQKDTNRLISTKSNPLHVLTLFFWKFPFTRSFFWCWLYERISKNLKWVERSRLTTRHSYFSSQRKFLFLFKTFSAWTFLPWSIYLCHNSYSFKFWRWRIKGLNTKWRSMKRRKRRICALKSFSPPDFVFMIHDMVFQGYASFCLGIIIFDAARV